MRKLGLPDGLFADCSEKLVAAWRARAIKMYPSDFRDTAEDVRITLLAALCTSRQAEITDALVDLLVALVHKINARAERRVEKQLTAELKKVRGKEGILVKLATAAVGKPDEVVRRALFPIVGEMTLRELVAEAKANEKVFKAKVRTTLRSSYSSYYRQMLPPLLKTLGFRCDNTAYRPVMDALALLAKYADVDGKIRFYDATDVVPMDGVVRKDWREAVVDDMGRIERIPYELCVLVALRDAVRRREIYVEGAARWCNPEDDLPGAFEATRAVHYAAIRQPLNPRAFIADLKKRMTAALDGLSAALADGSAGGVKVTIRKGEPWITVPKLEPLAEPTGLAALKEEVARRWGVLDLLDVLKNADSLTGFTEEFSSVAAYERIERDVLQRRLLLALFALGTNMGIRAIVATGEHGESEAALRHVRRHFITVDSLRAAVTRLVNATFAARDTAWWGQGTACASDSEKFGSWSSNFMTEYHARYGGNGVMIYWHVERKNVCIYSQLKNCSSSEVAAMIEGLLRHCADAEIESNYVDTHGASVVGFAFTELLKFRLLPRLKEHRQYPAVPPGRCPARLADARHLADAADPLGADRAAIRPDGQVRHRAPARHGGGGAGAAALHPRRPQAPHLPGPRRTRPRSSHGLRLRLPRQPRPAPRDPRRAPGRGELEQREHRAPLRQGRRPDRPGQGTRRDVNARPAPAPVCARARQHPAGAAGPGRTGMGEEAERRGPAWPDRAVLVERQPVRHLPPGHGQAPRPGVHRASPPHPGGRRRPIEGGDTMKDFQDLTYSRMNEAAGQAFWTCWARVVTAEANCSNSLDQPESSGTGWYSSSTRTVPTRARATAVVSSRSML